jgi:PAS domain S-box-containing protein
MSERFVSPALSALLCLVFLIFLIWQISVPALAQVQPQGSSVPAPKQIVLLYSYGDGLMAYQQATPAFLSIMEKGRVSEKNLFFEYLDLERAKDKEHYKNLTTLLLHKYATQKIDLIVTVHGPALKFLLNEGRDLFPGTPVLSYLGPDRIETTGIERRFVLLPMSMDFRGTLKLAQNLFPQTMRVVFVNGIGEGEKRLEREAKSVFVQWPDKLEFEYTSDLSVEEMLQRIATLSPGTIVIYSNVFTDKTGREFVARDVAEKVAKVANVPVFGMYNTLLGKGIIGGSVFNFETEGARAGTLALDILRGKLPLSKPTTVLTASRTPMFDWQQLKRWGVNISRLPEGSIIVNRPTTVWSQHKGYIMATVALALLESALIIFLIVQRRRKRVAEEELNQFFTISLDLKCIANTDGYFLRLNPAWERELGYTLEELMAKRFLEFVHPDDLGRTREAVSTLASQQKVVSFENRYRCKDGTYRWLEWISAPAGKLIYAAARDITERKKAEEALEERLRFEVLLAEISTRFINLRADQIDRDIEGAQRRICEFIDVDRSTLWQMGEEYPGTLLLTHIYYPPGSPPPPKRMNAREFFPWTMQKVLAGETVIISKMTEIPPEAGRDRENFRAYGSKSAVFVPLSIGEGTVFGGLGFAALREERSWPEAVVMGFKIIAQVFANALARKRAEEALEERLQFERLLSDLSARFVNIPPDRVDSEIEDGLRQILELFQVDRSGLLRLLPNKASWQVTHIATSGNVPTHPAGVELPRSLYPWAYDKLAQKHEVMSISRLDDLPAEADVDRQSCIEWSIQSYVNVPVLIGESVSHIIHVSSVKSGRVWPEELLSRLRLLGEIFVNALERKRAEAQVARARAELLHVERLSSLSELTASLAHELNQPLAAILSNAQAALRFLKSDKPDLNEFQEIMQDIVSDDQRAGNVIRSVRSMIKREEGEKRTILLNDILNDVIQIFRSEAIFRNVGIETELDEFLPPVLGDKVQLQQVLINIVMNGAEAMSGIPPGQRKLILRTQRKDHSLCVSVRDFGPGIDKGNLERVFEPFFTTKGTGLGMGLAVCSSIMKNHGGRIWAENNLDGGATFFIELPIGESGK